MAPKTNQTSNQTSGGSLVSWPRLPRFSNFPFRFPFRGEKGSDLGMAHFSSASLKQKSQLTQALKVKGGTLAPSLRGLPFIFI